jgi:hypothetical protein
MKVFIIAFLLLISSVSYASDKWTITDTVFESSFEALNTMDWIQTLNMTKQSGYYELGFPRGSSWIIGKYPKQAHVNELMLSEALIHPAVSYLLPQPYRRIWQGLWIVPKAITVRNNEKAGVGAMLGATLLF